jgi:hypothetical protein
MAIKFHMIYAGDVLYDVHRYRMGNTKMSATGVWKVEVLEVDSVNERALVRWNGNRPEWRNKIRMERLRRSPPKKLKEPL